MIGRGLKNLQSPSETHNYNSIATSAAQHEV